jgi:hypothetical protein
MEPDFELRLSIEIAARGEVQRINPSDISLEMNTPLSYGPAEIEVNHASYAWNHKMGFTKGASILFGQRRGI